jgi:Fe-S cluster biosynthesis and repair protein YggX
VADERGDNMPRDEMAKMLAQLGQPVPASKRAATAAGDGFRCQRPGCMHGRYARQLPAPPMNDNLGRRIQETVCAECWNDWLRNYSIKVINELRLDLSTELGQEEYDRYMREYLGIQ